MAVTSGTRLGVYNITAQIGEGGMGQVFRARDTKLDRDVAIKILPETFAHDADRLARFTREAKTLASLNHPHVAGIYGLEESDGVVALVMELVEGEDLSQRIARGAIPTDEALPIAKQIAEALEAAHEQGIIHRDLKPANIKVRADGVVKVLDFGLAKALDPTMSSSPSVTMSPTLSIHATQAGVILGTAAYMSPEQARGMTVDKRADLWALGVVLWEMLTGLRLFEGVTVSDTLASVLKTDPDWMTLPIDTPAAIRRLLRRCLDKDRRRRLDSAAAAQLELDEASAAPADGVGITIPTNAETRARNLVFDWRRTVSVCVATAALTAVPVLLVWAPWRREAPAAAVRVSAELGADVSLSDSPGNVATLSPDGAVVAFVAKKRGDGSPLLYLRRLAQLQATPLPGTDDADSPFFSPDGQWIAFFSAGKLKKISVAGGAAVTLCDAPNGRGGAWGEDGTIVFTPDSQPDMRLLRVSSGGGTPEPLTALAEGEVTQRWPQVLPHGKAVLFTSNATNAGYDNANIVAQPLPIGARKIVHRGGYYSRYLPSGHLVYVHDGTLFAATFDLDRLEVTGQPVPAVQGVTSNAGSGSAQFDLSATGTLLYLPGQTITGGVPIQWMTRDGKTMPLQATPAIWFNPRFAPDGRRLAMDIIDGGVRNVWVYEWARDTLTRVTFGPGGDSEPVWTPDGRRIVFASARADKSPLNLYWQLADGTGDAQRLTESKNLQSPASWHPGGKFLAFEEQSTQTNYDLMILPMEGDEASGWKPGKPTVFLNSPFAEREPMFSPDGRWLAYVSNETGRQEVYVRPFPGPGRKWQISTGGGKSPIWSRTKREIFYGTSSGQIMSAAFEVDGDSFGAEKPRIWSDGRVSVVRGNQSFDLHPDGERLAVAPGPEQTQGGAKQDHVTFIFNFFDELRRIAPAKK